MNDPEVTMSNAAENTNLVAHSKALEAAGIAINRSGARDAMNAFDQVRAMIWRLLNPKS